MNDPNVSEANGTCFRAMLRPHRSLSSRGFLLLMLFLGAVSLTVGGYFAAMGAWPVIGFFGLDVLAVYLAFRYNYRSGNEYETVEVTPSQTTLTRVSAGGKTDRWDFNTYWVRVLLAEWPDGRTVLRLASHGRELVFAKFLTDDERRDFAGALKDALSQARAVRG